jgi:hypothetical protein
LAALIAATDNAMMVSPSERSTSCHQKYHKNAGMQWNFTDPSEIHIPEKAAENSHLRHILGRLGKASW